MSPNTVTVGVLPVRMDDLADEQTPADKSPCVNLTPCEASLSKLGG
jgi:hypothetical protein